MRVELIKSSALFSLGLLLSPVAAVDIWYHGSGWCEPPASSINHYNVPSNTCDLLNVGRVASVSFHNLPSGAKGQAYSSATTCNAYLGELWGSGPGTQCLSDSQTSIRSANWFYPYKRLVRKEEEELLPQRYSIRFELPGSSITREVEISFEEISRAWELLGAKNYEELNKFPPFVHA